MSTAEEIARYNEHVAAVEKAMPAKERAALDTIASINAIQARESCLRVALQDLTQARQELEHKLRDQLVAYARSRQSTKLHCAVLGHWAMVLRHDLPLDVIITLSENSHA